MNLQEALEQSLTELQPGLTDSTEIDLPIETVEEPEDVDAGEVGDESEESEDDNDVEDTGESESISPEAVRVEVDDDSVLVLPDGTEVSAKDAILFQKDYTKKTQQLSEERKKFESERQEFDTIREEVVKTYDQMRDWYESRVQNRPGWIQEIVLESDDPTATIARAVYELAQAGSLDPTFVETFGLNSGEFAEKQQVNERDAEIKELRLKVEARERAEQEQAAIQRQAAEYQKQWETIKSNHGLMFESLESEAEAKKELFDFAVSNRATASLVDAYDLMIVRTGRVQPATSPTKVVDEEVVAKKRASRAVTPKSASLGGAKQPRPKSTREAALQSLDEFISRA